MKTRFAPSPTGLMHFGNLRTALFNFLLAKRHSGQFLLRIEDTDHERSEEPYVESLKQDLSWLGLEWDELARQSTRDQIYAKYYEQLIAEKRAYPCFCSEQKLAIIRKTQLAAGQPPRYPGTCRSLSEADIEKKLAAGEKPALRFWMPANETITFTDLVKGPQRFESDEIGDFIIRRNVGHPSFMFCNAIDDAMMQVTHALRGEDHLTNTPRQIMILKTLGLAPPQYGHFPMIHGQDGAPLSKRNGSEAVQALREQGYLPLGLLNHLARLGHYYADNDLLSLEKLANQFDLNNINTSAARHDARHLKHWQKLTVLQLSNDDMQSLVQSQVGSAVPATVVESFSQLMHENILMPTEINLWANALFAESLQHPAEVIEELKQVPHDFLDLLQSYIAENTQVDYTALTNRIKEQLGLKGKKLFMPLRLIFTGQAKGPELAKMLAMMPQTTLQARVQQVQALNK